MPITNGNGFVAYRHSRRLGGIPLVCQQEGEIGQRLVSKLKIVPYDTKQALWKPSIEQYGPEGKKADYHYSNSVKEQCDLERDCR